VNKMERRWMENIKKMRGEELLRIIERGKNLAILAANEAIEKFEKGEQEINGDFLCAALEIKSTPSTKREVKAIKEKIAKIISDRFLNEKRFLTVLNQEEIGMEIKESITDKCLEIDRISNYALRKIIKVVPSRKDGTAKKLWSQNPNSDDLSTIAENIKGPLKVKAAKKLSEIGDIDDISYLIAFGDDAPLAKILWQNLKRTGRLSKLENGDLADIAEYTKSRKIKGEALKELKNRNELEDDDLELIFDNAHYFSNPEKIRKEVITLLLPKDLSIEKMLKMIKQIALRELRIKLAEKAVRAIDRKIIELIESPPNEWREKEIKDLKKKKSMLKAEIELNSEIAYVPPQVHQN